MLLEIRDVEKSFDDLEVLCGLSFTVAAGEIVVLLGPSGCGKTTLLRIIAGLEKQYKGDIIWQGREIREVPVHRRGFGMVFQDFALFPHKSVAANIEFGLKMQSWQAADRRERVNQMLDLVGLRGYGNRPVYDLSGGEKQRIALARSLAPSPRMLLLDEPLSSLDRALRERLMVDLRQILKQAGEITGHPDGISSIYVTHDQEEAFSLADRIIVMGKGRVEQIGNPVQLYSRPRNSYVAHFLGMGNQYTAELVSVEPPIARTPLGDLRFSASELELSQRFILLIRPEAGELVLDDSTGPNVFQVQIQDISFRGRHQLVNLSLQGTEGEIELSLEFPSSVPRTGV
jgi:thiamine transport system ATP-binding protein/spermidine/putrescine transport system ATP-binding protein